MSTVKFINPNNQKWVKMTFHFGQIDLADSKGNKWHVKNYYGVKDITDKDMFGTYLDFYSKPNSVEQSLHAYLWCSNPNPDFIAQPLAELMDYIAIDYLMGRLNWFKYNNETYHCDGYSLVRLSDQTQALLPSTGSSFATWNGRDIEFE